MPYAFPPGPAHNRPTISRCSMRTARGKMSRSSISRRTTGDEMEYGRFPSAVPPAGKRRRHSCIGTARKSASTISTDPPANRSRRCAARPRSTSTATTCAPASASDEVSAPSPGPISRYGGWNLCASATILRATFRSARKFCPRDLRGDSPRAARDRRGGSAGEPGGGIGVQLRPGETSRGHPAQAEQRHHRRVVGAQGLRGEKRADPRRGAPLQSQFPQAGIRRYASGQDHPRYPLPLRRFDRLPDENLDNRFLEGGGDVLRPRGLPFRGGEEGPQRRLEPREGEVRRVPGEPRPREAEPVRVPLPPDPVDRRTAGVRKPHHLRRLVERLPRRVVPRAAQEFHLPPPLDAEQGGVAAGHQKRDVREGDFVLEEDGVDVRL